jgi:anti-sigma B factor antagonist
MDFELRSHQAHGARVIAASGKLHLGEATTDFRDAIREELNRGERHFLINLAEVGSIDSAGIGELIWAQSAAARSGGSVKIVSIPTRVESILRLTRLLMIFDIWPDEASAIESLALNQ